MRHDSTIDTTAANLRSVAELVVADHAAAPCAVVGGAVRGSREGLPVSTTSEADGWRFGWGAAGVLWTRPPALLRTEPPSASTHHIFDLASLTKPIVALTLARLQQAGTLDRREPLAAFLPELADTPSGSVSLDLLSAHRAGLEAHRPFFVAEAGATQPDAARVLAEAAAARRAECVGVPPREGFPPVYSDLGYMLIGEALARRAGVPLDDLVAREVTRPLGLTLGSVRYLERQEPMAQRRLVPTEDVAWRGGVLHGVVHDENAWILAGKGTAGHAGLFGDVWSVVRLGTAIVDAWWGRRERWLDRASLEPLVAVRPGGPQAAGFERRSPGRDGGPPSSGALFGPETVGHLGFTGTSLWVDLQAQRVGVLLTNRVHPSRDHIAIRAARPAVYDALVEALG